MTNAQYCFFLALLGIPCVSINSFAQYYKQINYVDYYRTNYYRKIVFSWVFNKQNKLAQYILGKYPAVYQVYAKKPKKEKF